MIIYGPTEAVFWKGQGKGHVVEKGKQTRFWKNVWLDECSQCTLEIAFPHLFRICQDQDISVEKAAYLSGKGRAKRLEHGLQEKLWGRGEGRVE